MRERLSAMTDMQDQLESTEDKIKQNIEDCDNKLQAEQQRRREVHTLLQQIDKLKNDIKSIDKESGKNPNYILVKSVKKAKLYVYFRLFHYWKQYLKLRISQNELDLKFLLHCSI